MNSSVSSFFSRDVFLRRQSRTSRSRKNAILNPSTMKNSLHIIPEEDEPRTSSSSLSPSPLTFRTPSPNDKNMKAKRRHANVTVSDIRIARDNMVQDISEQSPTLLSAPRPAPRPPTGPSPSHSPDSFSLTFTEKSFSFPRPPIPTPSSSGYRSGSESPTPSMSTSTSSSPASEFACLPKTPSTSDSESSPPSSPHVFNPRRASIKPLLIAKYNAISAYPLDDSPISPTLRQPFKNEDEQLIAAFRDVTYESDPESDSEWYNQEFSKILTLCSPRSPSPQQQSRPESLAIIPPSPPRPAAPVVFPVSPCPARTPRPLPPIPTAPISGYPSAQLDPAFPRRRRSHSRSIPKRAPPPVPSIPAHFRSESQSTPASVTSSPEPSPAKPSTLKRNSPPNLSLRRPPPRSSVPADFVFDDEDDDLSDFSFSLYTDEVPAASVAPSPNSVYSQPSFQDAFGSEDDEQEIEFAIDDVQFDLDINLPMRLPLSLPGSPIDLEADIANGLEQLRLQEPRASRQTSFGRREPQTLGDVFSASSSDEGHALKSRWSSSTLSSLVEEQDRKSASAKLRLYFGGANSQSPKSHKRAGSQQVSMGGSWKKPVAPPLPTPLSPSKRFRMAAAVARRESDVMVIGYGQRVRRSGSVSASVSDAGSEESAASSTSSGLRRKPIPVEMFLRSSA